MTAKDVADAAQQGDRLAQRIIHDTGSRLGEALAILVDLFNPERIVIGGLAMRLGESLLGAGTSGNGARSAARIGKDLPDCSGSAG